MANAKVIIKAESDLSKGLNKAKYELQDFGKAASTIGSSISSMISKHAGIAALVGSITALGAAVKSCVEEYASVNREQERFAATMQNLTKTTGVSATAVMKLADAYEQTTYFSAEAIASASQLLLATEEIGSVVFPRAIDATLDLAEALGQDVTSAASMMQKALADPESGLRSLRTAGINFTDSEEDLIESLIAANDKLAAQELILQKVEERYKGVAKAVADTPLGKIDALKDAWGAFKENIGAALIDSIEPAIDFLLEKLQKVNDMIQETEVVERTANSGKITDDGDYYEIVQYVNRDEETLNLIKSFKDDLKIIKNGYGEFEIAYPSQEQRLAFTEETGYNISIDPKTGEWIETIPEMLERLLGEYEKENPEMLSFRYSYSELKDMFEVFAEEEEKRQRLYTGLLEGGFASDSLLSKYATPDPTYTYLEQYFKTHSLDETGNDDDKKDTDPLKEIRDAISSTATGKELDILDEIERIDELYEEALKLDNNEDLLKGLDELRIKLLDELSSLKNPTAPYNFANELTTSLAALSRAEDKKNAEKLAEEEYARIKEERDKKKDDEFNTVLNEILTLYSDTSYGKKDALISQKEMIEGYIDLIEEYQATTAEETLLKAKLVLGLGELVEDIDKQLNPKKVPPEEPTLWDNMGEVWDNFSAEADSMALLTDSMTSGFGTLLDSLSPVTDILFTSSPLLTMLAEIINSFVSTLAPMISATLAPLSNMFKLIGSTLANLFVPLLNALYPAIHDVANIIMQALAPAFDLLAMVLNIATPIISAISGIIGVVADAFMWLYEPLAWLGDLFGYVGETLATLGENIGVFFHNLTHWFNPRDYVGFTSYEDYKKQREQAREDAYNQYPTLDYSTDLATQNASYTGGNTVTINIYQQAPVVGDGGMNQFATMIREKFVELDYFGR